MTEHLSDRLLAEFANGELDGAGSARVVQHLVVCTACASSLASRQTPNSEPDTYQGLSQETLARLQELREKRLAAQEQAAALFAEVAPHPPLRLLTMIRNSRRYESPEFVRLLLTRVRQQVFESPAQAVQFGLLGVELAERVEVEGNSALTADLRAAAWAELGNARRAASDLPGARTAFGRAATLLESGSGDPMAEAHLSEVMLGVPYAERRYDEALRFARRTLRLRHDCGDLHLEGRARMAVAMVLSHLDRIDESLTEGEIALSQLDAEREPGIYLAMVHNLAVTLEVADRIPEALALVARSRQLPTGPLFRAGKARMRWLEAKLTRKQGGLAAAEAIFGELVDEFLDIGMPDEAAGNALELATLLFETGRLTEVRQLATRTLAIFQSLGIHREALAAYSLLQRAAEAETLTLTLLAQLNAYFRDFKYRQAVPFRPEAAECPANS